MSRRFLRVALFVAVVAGAWALTASVEGMHVGWLSLLPALVLLVPLLAGRYVGEDVLDRLAGGVRATPRRAREPAARLRRTPVRAAHGGLLLACRVAGRAPPVVPVTG